LLRGAAVGWPGNTPDLPASYPQLFHPTEVAHRKRPRQYLTCPTAVPDASASADVGEKREAHSKMEENKLKEHEN
jgi:hypothetical protein